MLPLWSGWTAGLCQQAVALAQLPAATLPALASFALVVLLQAALAFALSLLPPIVTVSSLYVKSGSCGYAPLEWQRLRRRSDHPLVYGHNALMHHTQAVREHWTARQAAAAAAAAAMQRTLSDEAPVVGVRFEVRFTTFFHTHRSGAARQLCMRQRWAALAACALAFNIVLRTTADVEGWVAVVQGFDAAFSNGVASAQPDPTPAAGTAMEQTVKVLFPKPHR
jgi:hypothetical protein